MEKEQIAEELHKQIVNNIQIDTTNNCGSKCWYCPVRYFQRPTYGGPMPKDIFRDILKQVKELQEENIVTRHPTVWLSAYGDPLMDPYLEDRLLALREFPLRIPIVTNGIGIQSNLAILSGFTDVIGNYSINLPAGNPQDYLNYTMNSEKTFERIISGIITLSRFVLPNTINVNVNGAYDDEFAREQLKVPLPEGDTSKQVEQLTKIFEDYSIKVDDARPLCDRAGILKDVAINNSAPLCRAVWNLPIGSTVVKGCNAGARLFNFMHVTNSGGMIICCQDYYEYFTFGYLAEDSMRDIWFSDMHIEAIYDSMRSMCLKCQFAL